MSSHNVPPRQSIIGNPMENLPSAIDAKKVGYYNSADSYNDGYFWDDLLEYRVRCRALPCDEEEEILYCFKDYPSAFKFYTSNDTAYELNALITQHEYITSDKKGFNHIKNPRTVEWPVHFLLRPKGSQLLIQLFLELKTHQEKTRFLQLHCDC